MLQGTAERERERERERDKGGKKAGEKETRAVILNLA
jgi:hypothetical protein